MKLESKHIEIIKQEYEKDSNVAPIVILHKLGMTGNQFRDAYLVMIKEASYFPKDNILFNGFDMVYDQVYIPGNNYNPIKEKLLLLNLIATHILGLDESLFVFYLSLSNMFDTLLVLKTCLMHKEAKYYYNLYYEYKKERGSLMNIANTFSIEEDKVQDLANQAMKMVEEDIKPIL